MGFYCDFGVKPFMLCAHKQIKVIKLIKLIINNNKIKT